MIRFLWAAAGVAMLSIAATLPARAELSERDRAITLWTNIYMTLSDDPLLDRDKDGLKDDLENALADTWRPYFIFDEKENAREQCSDVVTGVETVVNSVCVSAGCAAAGGLGCLINSVRDAIEATCTVTHNVVSPLCKGNVDDDSLQPFEPVVLFQAKPIGGDAWPRRIQIRYAFLFRLDGGFRASNVCTNYHYGDTQSGTYQLVSDDGTTWKLDQINLWQTSENWNSAAIEWTAPRPTYSGQLQERPSPIVYMSAGKHHQYISAQECENEPGTCDDDCGGGAERLANLTPQGSFTNVGEPGPDQHPQDVPGSNKPFVNDLGPLGYPNEYVWYAKWHCACNQAFYEDWEGECFTGGRGNNWSASTVQKCDLVTPVYKLFDPSPPAPPTPETGTLITVISSCL